MEDQQNLNADAGLPWSSSSSALPGTRDFLQASSGQTDRRVWSRPWLGSDLVLSNCSAANSKRPHRGPVLRLSSIWLPAEAETGLVLNFPTANSRHP